MGMQAFSVIGLVGTVAYLLMAYGFYLLSERFSSGDAKIAAIALAYCGLAGFAQVAAMLGQSAFAHSSLGMVLNSMVFQWLVGGLRPFALLVAAICTLRLAKSIPGPAANP